MPVRQGRDLREGGILQPRAGCQHTSCKEHIFINTKEAIMGRKREIKEEIASIAYTIYEQRGTHGLELEDWLEAERIVLARLPPRKPSEAAKDVAASRKKCGTAKKKKMSGTEL